MNEKKKHRGHYIRKNYTSALPYRLLFFDTETLLDGDESEGLQKFRIGAACHVKNTSKNFTDYQEKWYELYSLRNVYEMFDSLAYEDSVLHVYGSNLSFDISACLLVDYFTKSGWELKAFREKGLTFILIIKQGKKKIKFMSMQNFIPTSIKKIGKLIGIEKQEIEYDTNDVPKLMAYCRNDVLILKEAILSWYRFVLEHDMGGHAITLPSQAFRAFRHRFMKEKLLVHCRDELSEYERYSYHGGRCEAFRIGKQPKQDYVQLDVNSMYPFVMSNNEYPSCLIGFIERDNMIQLHQKLKNHCVLALVYIQTDKPVYLKVIDNRACFPVGSYWSILSTRELKYGFKHGLIKKVYSGAYYKKRFLFKEYMKYFYDMRKEYTENKNNVYRNITKLFMNSLYGKFGEKYDHEVSNEFTESNDMRVEQWYNAETDTMGTELVMLHRTIQTAGQDEGQNSIVSIASHVTADARMLLWKFIESVGMENVYYMDTDSLITTKEQSEKHLSKFIGDNIGQLKVEMESDEMELTAPKNYRFGTKRVLKGVQRIATVDGKEEYHSLHSLGLKTLARRNITDGAVLRPVTLTLTEKYTKGTVNVDGSVSPFVLSETEHQPLDELSRLSLHDHYAQ